MGLDRRKLAGDPGVSAHANRLDAKEDEETSPARLLRALARRMWQVLKLHEEARRDLLVRKALAIVQRNLKPCMGGERRGVAGTEYQIGLG